MKIILNIPNTLTILRIISVPFFIYFLFQEETLLRNIAFILFTLASFTDLADGYIARKYRQETELGRFLDPIADKALVISSLLTFLLLTEQIQIWMVLCIIGRDIIITLLRLLAIRQGKTLQTSIFGKCNTAFQMFSLSIILLSVIFLSYKERNAINQIYLNEKENFGLGTWKVANINLQHFIASSWDTSYIIFDLASFVPYFLMLISTILTVISGLHYFFTNYTLLFSLYKK